jgi:Raf kinase inhibitor-like YbhB/YbcL family protein
VVGQEDRTFAFRNSLQAGAFLASAFFLFISIFPSPLQAQSAPQAAAKKSDQPFQLTSTAFEPDGAIPVKYSCADANISPALAWTDPPAGTQSYVLIVDDPAVHWLVYAIPAMQRGLPENTLRKATLPNSVRQGKNSAGKVGYGGPCPDPGQLHHYFFKLYALDYLPDLKAKAKVADVEAAIRDHVLAKSELIGRYQRE